MRIIKFIQFAYLAFAALFFYDGISKWNEEGYGALISLFLGALALFMFFFRRNFRKKMEDKNK
ncbi:MAG: hypothetical protein BM564_12705 [Bacteroidetes bacterium MedPE-SWsnd-G2]|nr:MAG: hypothetical protein BM564_12705 [Bacteroidetes bacterium MedPE-SWsnd-G2]